MWTYRVSHMQYSTWIFRKERFLYTIRLFCISLLCIFVLIVKKTEFVVNYNQKRSSSLESIVSNVVPLRKQSCGRYLTAETSKKVQKISIQFLDALYTKNDYTQKITIPVFSFYVHIYTGCPT